MSITEASNDCCNMHEVITELLGGYELLDSEVEEARETLDTIRRQAASYGLTDAEVVKAVFRPLFEVRDICGCNTCVARRDREGSNYIRCKTKRTESSLWSGYTK